MSESASLKRILVLDDDADFRALLRSHLGKLFDRVEVQEYDPVARGAPGEDFDWSRYDVLILDYYLCIHNLTGLDILQANRKNKFFPATIMLTGAGSEEVAVRAVKAGVYDYLRKEKLDKEQLKRSILNAFEQHKEEQQRLSELTNQSLAFNKALFYQELESDRSDSGKDRVLLLIQLDDDQTLEQRLGGILRDNIVRHIARRSFEVFQVGECHPHITRLGEAAVAMLIDKPESQKTLDFNMNGLCAHLKKRPYKFDDKKFRFSVSIGVVEIPHSGRTADRLIQQGRRAAEIAARTEGNSFHFFLPEDEPAQPEPAAAIQSTPVPSIDTGLVEAIDTIVEEPPEPPPALPLSLASPPVEAKPEVDVGAPQTAGPESVPVPAAVPRQPAPISQAPAASPTPTLELSLEPIAEAPAAPPPAPAPRAAPPPTATLTLEPIDEVSPPPPPVPAATPKPVPPAKPAAAPPKSAAPTTTKPAPAATPKPVAQPAATGKSPAKAAPAVPPAHAPARPSAGGTPAAPKPAPAAAKPAAPAVKQPAAPAPSAPAAAPATARPASDDVELDEATLSEAARSVRKAFEEKRVVQTFQPVMPLFNVDGAELPEVYRVRLQMVDRDGSIKIEDFIYAEANTPSFQKFIDRWLLRETIGRVVNNPRSDQVFIIRISEPSLADPSLFNWLRKLLSGLDKQRPGKSIALEMSASEFTNQQKKAAALIAYLGKSQGFRFVMAQVHEPEQAGLLAGGQSGIELLKIGVETLQKLKATPAASGQTGSLFDGLVGKGIQIIADGVEDATTLTNIISTGAHYAMGNFIGEPVQHIEESTNVESFEIT